MAINWGQMYSQGSSYQPAKKKKKQTYTWKKNDSLWKIAKNYGVSPSQLLKDNPKLNKPRPGVSLNIYDQGNTFNAAQSNWAKKRKDRRDKRQYNPQGVGGIRPEVYTTITNPQSGDVLFSSVQPRTGGSVPGYQQYRMNWFAEQGILPLTVNEWVADELGYTDLLKEYGYRLNTELNRWERPMEIPMKGSGSGGGSGYGGGYGSGGGRRGGGGGGYTLPAPDAGMGFGGAYSPQGGGYASPRVSYSPRGTTRTGRPYGGSGLITWRI